MQLHIRTYTFAIYLIVRPLNINSMNNQTQFNNNRNESKNTSGQTILNPVNILSFLEEGNLQKRFFSGQITVEEYQRKKKMLKKA